MQLKRGDIVEVAITDLAFGGAGVGKMKTDQGDFVVFVAGTVPGDVALAKLYRIKKQFAEADMVEIRTPSKVRISPRCKHFGVCGGCSLQYVSYDQQLAWKEKMVRDALQKIGGFDVPPILPILGCADPWFYRNKMEYSFGNRHGDAAEATSLGFHPAKKYQEVFDVEECFLQSLLSVKILDAVRHFAREHALSAYDPRANTGTLKNLVVREGKNTGEILVNLITNGRDFPLQDKFATWIMAAFPQITSLYRTAVTVQKGHRTVVEEFHLAGKSTLTETMSLRHGKNTYTLSFDIYPQAFFQPNTKQAEVLYAKILELANPQKTDSVLDLYCGTGTIGMFFAKTGCRVVGIELNQDAVKNAQNNATKNGIESIEFHSGDVDQFLTSKLSTFNSQFSILITDPPRAGIATKSLNKIIDRKIPTWIYVSCNPTTLARDLKIICAEGYRLEKAQPVDMFPHTYHIETICLLKRT